MDSFRASSSHWLDYHFDRQGIGTKVMSTEQNENFDMCPGCQLSKPDDKLLCYDCLDKEFMELWDGIKVMMEECRNKSISFGKRLENIAAKGVRLIGSLVTK